MQIKKLLSIAMALTLSFGAVQTIGNCKSASYVSAEEEEEPFLYQGCISFDSTTGTLALYGDVKKDALKSFNNENAWLGSPYKYHGVKTIVATPRTVLPEDSSFLFAYFTEATTINLNSADTSKVTNMKHMFYDNTNLEKLSIKNFDTSNVTNMSSMFYDCPKLKDIDLSSFDTSKVVDMSGMFNRDKSLSHLDMKSFNTSKVTDMNSMFSDCEKLRYIDGFHSLDVSNVKDMSFMFKGCKTIESLQMQFCDTSKVTKMESMFADCTSLKEVTFDGFDENLPNPKFLTYNVSTFENMFLNCKSLQTLKLSNFSASSAINTSGMFMNCENLEWISLTDFAASKHLIFTSNMFSGCSNLETIYMDEDWPDSFKENVRHADNMFLGCTKLKGQYGTIYDPDKVGPQYAILDRETGNPGYFTAHAGYFLPIMPEVGDTNNDGRIDATDASNILAKYSEYSTSNQSPTAYELEVYDVNRDGRVNATDASYVLSYYAYTQTGGTDSFADYMKTH